MVAITVKILFIAIAIIFIDLLTAPLFPEGGLIIQGESLTLVTLLLLVFDTIIAFLLLIAHALTHLAQSNVVSKDFTLLVSGVMSLFFLLVESVLQIVVWMVTLPFRLISLLLSDKVGLGIKLDLGNGMFGIYVNLETLTFQISISPIPVKKDMFRIIEDTFNIKIETCIPIINECTPINSGFAVQMKNVISFSFLPPPDSSFDILGNTITSYVPHDNNFGFVIVMFDIVSTRVPLLGYFEIGINTNAFKHRDATYLEISLGGLLDQIVAGLSIDTLAEWIDNVYDTVVPSITSETIIISKELKKVLYYV